MSNKTSLSYRQWGQVKKEMYQLAIVIVTLVIIGAMAESWATWFGNNVRMDIVISWPF